MIKWRFLTQTAPRVAVSATLGLATLMMTAPTTWACSKGGYLGSLCIMAGNTCPDGTVEAKGQLLLRSNYSALYGLYECKYGGDCITYFAVPDFRRREMVHYGKGQDLRIPAVFAKPRGSETVPHTVATMAPHTHTIVPISTATGTAQITVVAGEASADSGTATPQAGTTYSLGGVGGKAQYGPYTTGKQSNTPAKLKNLSFTASTAQMQVESTGKGKEETNIPPQLVLNICVVTEGPYPPRSQ